MTDPMTSPPNAPEAGSNGERDELIAFVMDIATGVNVALLPRIIADAAALVERTRAAGFTRAHHDGERVARLTEQRDALCADHLAALRKLDAAIRERDEARANHDSACKLVADMHAVAVGSVRGPIVGVVEDVAALRAERDALAAKLNDAEKWQANMIASRDREAARAVVAEQQVAMRDMALDHLQQRYDAAEARLLKLIDAMQHIASHRLLSHEVVPYASAALAGNGNGTGEGFDLVAHLHRQRAFSERTFGPGARTAGVLDHIRKELREIEADPKDVSEWIDVVLLAFDGAWRHGHTPESIAAGLAAKQAKNEARTWPDWRTAPKDRAIEHDRTGEAPLPAAPPSAGETNRE